MSINRTDMNSPLLDSNDSDSNNRIDGNIYSPIEQHALNDGKHVIDTISHKKDQHNNNNKPFRPSLSDMIMAPGAKPGEYISRQAARESNNIKICGIGFKYYVLLCICLLTFGSYWVFDTPGALESQFTKWFGNGYNSASNDALYSVYSFPNCVLALFGGFFVDKLTVRRAALLFTALVTLGELIFCLGVEFKLYALAVVGRFIFGLGGESLTVAQNTYTIRWFDGARLALVFGLVVASSRIGTSVNFIVSPIFAEPPYGVPFSVWFGCLMCCLSLTTCIICGMLDKWGTNKIDEQRAQYLRALSPAEQAYIAAEDEKHEPTNDEVNLKDIRFFPAQAWLLYLITMFFYIAILTFNTVAQSILTKTGNKYDDKTAGIYMSIPSFVAIGASPFFGWLVDYSGRALYWIAGASTGMCVAHIYYLLMAYDVAFALTAGPIPIMIWIGVFYSMGASALWPILSFVLDKKLLGTGYGTMTAVQNLGLAIFPLIIGGIQNADGIKNTTWQYTVPIIIFIGCTATALIFTIILMRIDARREGLLNASASERKAKLDAKKAAEKEKANVQQA